MKDHESSEMYLETILILSERLGNVRSIDIANEMNFSKPSVSVGMKNLREQDLIRMDDNGHITLTDSGRKIAEMIYERHVVITSWLVDMGVSKDVAETDACRMEHVISAESFAAIKDYVEKNHQAKK